MSVESLRELLVQKPSVNTPAEPSTRPVEAPPLRVHPLTLRQMLLSGLTIAVMIGLFVVGPWATLHVVNWMYTTPDIPFRIDSGDGFMLTPNELTISNRVLTSADMSRIPPQRPVTQLALKNSASISPEAMPLLSKVSSMMSLSVDETSQFDLTLLPPQLTRLTLKQSTDAGVAQIAKLTGLQSLDLSGSAITDACVTDLLKLKKLTYLNVQDTALSGAALCRIAAGNKLLQMQCNPLASKLTVAESFAIRDLNRTFMQINWSDNNWFDQLVEVRDLLEAGPLPRESAITTGFSPPWLRTDYSAPRGYRRSELQVVVDFGAMIPTAEVLDTIKAWKVPLAIIWRPEADLDLVDQLVQIPHLRQLHLKLSDAKAAERIALALAEQSHITEVTVHLEGAKSPKITERVCEFVAAVARMPQLVSLNAGSVSEDCLEPLAGLSKLEELTWFTPQFTNDTITDLQNIPNLNALSLYTVDAVTDSQVRQLVGYRPGLRSLLVQLPDPIEQKNLMLDFPSIGFNFMQPPVVQPLVPAEPNSTDAVPE